MKVLFVESKLTGHHITYLKSLDRAVSDAYVVIPEKEEVDFLPEERVFCVNYRWDGKIDYEEILCQLKKAANIAEPDIIHFLYGDDLYRFFGWKLDRIYPKAKIVITCHQIRRGIFHDISYRCIGKKAAQMVVHTEKMTRDFCRLGIRNVKHIEYPKFSCAPGILQEDALKELQIQPKGKVILALGGTRYDKGLDILIDAVKMIRRPYHLIIAGREEYFKRQWIADACENIKDKTSLFIKFLSDEEFSLCLNAADIVCLPYRKSFDGASGPLAEGAALGRMIVGSDHGSLGQIIADNHLGLTFKCEDSCELSKALERALAIDWKTDGIYQKYQEAILPEHFQKRHIELYNSVIS